MKTYAMPQVIDLNTSEGMEAHVKTFTDAQLETLAASTSISHIVLGAHAEAEIILREAGLSKRYR